MAHQHSVKDTRAIQCTMANGNKAVSSKTQGSIQIWQKENGINSVLSALYSHT